MLAVSAEWKEKITAIDEDIFHSLAHEAYDVLNDLFSMRTNFILNYLSSLQEKEIHELQHYVLESNQKIAEYISNLRHTVQQQLQQIKQIKHYTR